MRKIKFRALGTKGWKQTEGKGWFYGTNDKSEYIGFLSQADAKPQHTSLLMFERNIQGRYLDENTRCQFSGFYDKTGKEVFERDIIKHRAFEMCVFVCVFEQGRFQFREYEKTLGIGEVWGMNADEVAGCCDIIGDEIHNKDLLAVIGG